MKIANTVIINDEMIFTIKGEIQALNDLFEAMKATNWARFKVLETERAIRPDQIVLSKVMILTADFKCVRDMLLVHDVKLLNEVEIMIDGKATHGTISRTDYDGTTDIATELNIPVTTCIIIACCESCDQDCIDEEVHDAFDKETISEIICEAANEEHTSGEFADGRISFQLKF